MNSAIWFITQAFHAAFPFLLVAALVSAYVGLMLAGRWFIQRGLRRRAERLHGLRRQA